MTGRRSSRMGFTLVEVLATIALLGLVIGMAGVTLASLKPRTEHAPLRTLDSLRAEAIRTGRVTTWQAGSQVARFFPDGSSSGGRFVVGGRTIVLDALTGDARVE